MLKTTPSTSRPVGKLTKLPKIWFEALNLLRTLLRKGSVTVSGPSGEESGGGKRGLELGRLYWILYFFLQRAQWPERNERARAG